ncbi:hypothetical protein Pelo_328 [Pelomyxa schiedti]|nr:hypothetical protein Pelo_328 [Pelomyxa schiedti]
MPNSHALFTHHGGGGVCCVLLALLVGVSMSSKVGFFIGRDSSHESVWPLLSSSAPSISECQFSSTTMVVSFGAGDLVDGLFYAINTADHNRLYSFTSGCDTPIPIGSTPLATYQVSGMTWSASTGTMYISYASPSGAFVSTIDLTSGNLGKTPIISSGSTIGPIAFDDTHGLLYVFIDNILHRYNTGWSIDKTWSYTFPEWIPKSLSYDKCEEKLYNEWYYFSRTLDKGDIT